MAELIQRSFSKGELSPSLHARTDLRMYALGLASCRNFFVHPEGGISTRAGFKWVGEVKDNNSTVRLIPFQFNTDQTYVLEFTDQAMRVIKDGGYVTETAQNITAITQANPAQVTIAGHGYSNGDQVYIADAGGMDELNNGWFTVTVVDVDNFTIGVDSTGYTAYSTGGTAAKLYTITTPYRYWDLDKLKYTQSADVMTIVNNQYAQRELTRTGHAAWTLSTISFTSTVAAPTGLTAAGGGTGGGTYNKTYEYVVTAVDADGKESLPSTAASATVTSLSETYYMALNWTAVTGAEYYNIYKAESEVSDVYGWIGKSVTTNHRDYNVKPDITDAPPSDRDPFAGGVGDWPRTVNYYQQRILYGSTGLNPQTIYGSQSGDYKSFRVSVPTKDDDAVTFTIASQKVNEIRHIVALDALILLTSGGEWKVTEGQDDVLTPSSVGVRPQSYYGASHVMPAVVGNTAIYIQERGSRVRDIKYTFESDTYTGSDLSILAQHLFEGYSISEMVYAQEPYSQLFLLRSDGVLLGCTYHQEHEIVAWYRFETTGTVKSITSISEDAVDALYLAVERSINGVTKRYVERMEPRSWLVAEDAFCVDCGSTYDSTATTTINGLRHLNGETVVALADGNVITGLTVTDGVVTLPYEASKVHIGLPYSCYIQTLPIDFNADGMTPRGKRKGVSSVVFTFLNSRGGWVGTNSGNTYEIKPRFDSDDYDAIALRSYDRELSMPNVWNDDGQVYYEQSDPLPTTILAIAPEVSFG